MTVPIRFAAYADSSAGPGGCWPWTSALTEHGYGLIHVDGKVRRATHVAVELDGRAVSEGQVVRHSCDNPPCVNPRHLRVGTQRDNVNDAMARGRAQRGSTNGCAVLDEDQVAQIRMLRSVDTTPYRDLADQFGVSVSTIARVVTGQGWRHV